MSATIKTGGTAFPMQELQAIHAYAMGRVAHIPAEQVDERDRAYLAARAEAVGGMSLRDHYAGLALASGQASNWRDNNFKPRDGLSIIENTAVAAYVFADAMLKAREGGAAC